MTTVAELIAELQKMPQDANVNLAVGWAKDTAISDDDEDLTVRGGPDGVSIDGWLSNCGTTLEIEDTGDYGSDDT